MQMYRLLNTEFLLAAVWDMSSSSHCLNKTAHCSIPTLKHASLYPHFKNAATSTAILMVCQKFKFLVQPLTSGLSLRRLEHVALSSYHLLLAECDVVLGSLLAKCNVVLGSLLAKCEFC